MPGGNGRERQEPWAAPGSGVSSHDGPSGPPSRPDAPPVWPSGPGAVPSGNGPWLIAPPARRSRTGLVLALIAGLAIVVAAAVALVVVVIDDDSGDARPTDAFAAADPADAATVAVPDDYVEVEAGDLRLSLPPSWVSARLDQDLTGQGARLAPDDAQMASDIDERLRMLPRSALLIGFDADDLDPRQFNTNALVMELPDALPDRAEDVRAALAAEMGALNARVSSVSYLSSAEGPVVRVRYRMWQQGIDVDFLQYWYVTPQGTYTLSVSSDDLDDEVEVADAMASSVDIDPTT